MYQIDKRKLITCWQYFENYVILLNDVDV